MVPQSLLFSVFQVKYMCSLHRTTEPRELPWHQRLTSGYLDTRVGVPTSCARKSEAEDGQKGAIAQTQRACPEPGGRQAAPLARTAVRLHSKFMLRVCSSRTFATWESFNPGGCFKHSLLCFPNPWLLVLVGLPAVPTGQSYWEGVRSHTRFLRLGGTPSHTPRLGTNTACLPFPGAPGGRVEPRVPTACLTSLFSVSGH